MDTEYELRSKLRRLCDALQVSDEEREEILRLNSPLASICAPTEIPIVRFVPEEPRRSVWGRLWRAVLRKLGGV